MSDPVGDDERGETGAGGHGGVGPLDRLRALLSEDRATAAGLAASGIWLLIVVLFWLLGPSDEGSRSGPARLATLAGIVLPVLLIWLAVGTSRALTGLRDEAHELRAQLLALRGGGAGVGAGRVDDWPEDMPAAAVAAPASQSGARVPAQSAAAAPRARQAAAGHASHNPRAPRAPRAPAATSRAEPPQPSLDLGAPAAVEIDPADLIAALNFPDGPDDHRTIAALRHALTDPETARLIRAAQDVVTLLAARGLYMDDLPPPPAPPESWRRFAEGVRGSALSGLYGASVDGLAPEAEAQLAEALRSDEVFRDTVHHFMRHWDRMLSRVAPVLSDEALADLAATRSGRAFVTLAAATGIFG